MPKTNLNHLTVAKKLAEESGRHLSDCLAEAAEVIIREQRKPRLAKVRVLYIVWGVVCAALVSDSGLNVINVGGFLPFWASFGLLALTLTNIFWLAPELPLMTNLWTRWNTPLFIAAMVFVLMNGQPSAHLVHNLAVVLFLGVTFLALLHGAKDPGLALEYRMNTTRLMFHTLSPRDQGRIFFLAPWISPFR